LNIRQVSGSRCVTTIVQKAVLSVSATATAAGRYM
jgi:hypothetical protein